MGVMFIDLSKVEHKIHSTPMARCKPRNSYVMPLLGPLLLTTTAMQCLAFQRYAMKPSFTNTAPRIRRRERAFLSLLSVSEDRHVCKTGTRNRVVAAANDDSASFQWLPARYKKSTSPEKRLISNLLVCGDGDLSFSASIAPQLSSLGIRFTASVLEEQSVHHEGK